MFLTNPNTVFVKSAITTAPPGSPNTTDVYIVPSGATGAWSGQTNKFARWNGSTWDFLTPYAGVFVWSLDTPPKIYQYNGSTFDTYNSGGAASGVTVREVDSSPSVSGVTTIVVTNGTLTDDGGGQVTIATGGGGSSPPFADNAALVKNNADNTKLLILSAANIAASTTRTATFPDADITVVGIAATQTLTNKTISTGTTVSASITWSAGVKQTFAPNATTAGLNVGSVAGDPSAPANGDLWYDSTANELTARINGANVALGAGGGGGVTGSGTANRHAKWSSASAIDASALRELNTRLNFNGTADPTTSYPRVSINDIPTGNGSTINWGNWNTTGFAVPFLITSERDNGGNTMIPPTPMITFGMSGVSGQSFGSDAAISMNRYSTGNNQSNTRLTIQVNNASSDYPSDNMSFYGTGRAGIGNGSSSTSGNDAKARLHIGDQLINSGTNFSTTSWNSQGLVPLLVNWDAQDATSGQLHPPLVLTKKGVAAGQEAQRVEFGLGRYETSANAPRTRFDIRLGHAVNETTGVRILSLYSWGGMALAMTNTVSPTSNNSDAWLQIADTPSNNGSFSVSNWNSTGRRLRTFIVMEATNGGSSPSAAEPALVLSRPGVTSQSFTNYVEFKVARYENSGTSARSALTIAATHVSEAAGIDIVEFRSDKSTLFKGQFGSPRNTQSGSGSQTVDWSLGNTFEQTATGNITTFTWNNAKAGSVYTMVITQGGAGSFTVSWPAAVLWGGGSAPTLTTTAGKKDIFVFYYDGTNFLEVSQKLNV